MADNPHSRTEPAGEIRPGVLRPDWTAITTAGARTALAGRMAARSGLLDKWSQQLGAAEDCVWRAILRLYACRGRPPEAKDIVVETGLAAGEVKRLFHSLRSRDLIDLDPNSRICLAYPFTEAATGHRVELNNQILHSLCAIDALGAAAMYRTDITITSSCRHCSASIEVKTAEEGKAIRRVTPIYAVVWYDFSYNSSAAASCCPAIAFFCSDEHLQEWLSGQSPQRDGARLTAAEALEVGRAIFGPVLFERSRETVTS